jgi:hypothetical protein
MTTELDPRVKQLIEWIATNAERESILLTPTPAWGLDAHATLHKIAELFTIPEDEMEQLVDEAPHDDGQTHQPEREDGD